MQSALQPVEGPLRSALGALGGLLSGLPDLRLPIKQVSPSSWLLNTYLGEGAEQGASEEPAWLQAVVG